MAVSSKKTLEQVDKNCWNRIDWLMNQTDLINSLVPGIPGLEEHLFGGAIILLIAIGVVFFFALALRGGIHRLAADYWRHRGVFGFPAFPQKVRWCIRVPASRASLSLFENGWIVEKPERC